MDTKQLIINSLIDIDSGYSVLIENSGDLTPLFGPGGLLDSLGLVVLVIKLEEGLRKHYGKSITLSSDRAMSMRNNPFATIKSLEEFIKLCVESS